MNKYVLLTCQILGAVLVSSASIHADESNFENATVRTVSVDTSFGRTMEDLLRKQDRPGWIAYEINGVEGNYSICCQSYSGKEKWTRTARPCKLESSQNGFNFHSDDKDEAGPRTVMVLVRADDQEVKRIRVFTDDCKLDVGGLPVIWISRVDPKQSVQWLTSIIDRMEKRDGQHKGVEQAVTALALHNEPSADGVLERLAESKGREELRKAAAFWMGNLRGKKGYELIRRLVRDDSNTSFREHLVFCLHISKVSEALDTMVEVSQHDQSAQVRGQAIFWLGQKGGKKAVDSIHRAIEKDRELEVRKKGVFALSQLKDDEGVPSLIRMARQNSNPEIRQESIFWLSQKAGEAAAAAISDAAESDPNTEVKKKAVFALSQLPKKEGVPRLIEVARNQRNSEVRKEAIFWLGQSKDPRAIEYFEEVLTKTR